MRVFECDYKFACISKVKSTSVTSKLSVNWLPSSGVVKLELKPLSSPLSLIGLSVQPPGLQALTVIMYRVDGVRPVMTPEEEHEHLREIVRKPTMMPHRCKYGADEC